MTKLGNHGKSYYSVESVEKYNPYHNCIARISRRLLIFPARRATW